MLAVIVIERSDIMVGVGTVDGGRDQNDGAIEPRLNELCAKQGPCLPQFAVGPQQRRSGPVAATRREINHPVISTLMPLALIVGSVGLTDYQQDGGRLVLRWTGDFDLSRIAEQASELILPCRLIGQFGDQPFEFRYWPRVPVLATSASHQRIGQSQTPRCRARLRAGQERARVHSSLGIGQVKADQRPEGDISAGRSLSGSGAAVTVRGI